MCGPNFVEDPYIKRNHLQAKLVDLAEILMSFSDSSISCLVHPSSILLLNFCCAQPAPVAGCFSERMGVQEQKSRWFRPKVLVNGVVDKMESDRGTHSQGQSVLASCGIRTRDLCVTCSLPGPLSYLVLRGLVDSQLHSNHSTSKAANFPSLTSKTILCATRLANIREYKCNGRREIQVDFGSCFGCYRRESRKNTLPAFLRAFCRAFGNSRMRAAPSTCSGPAQQLLVCFSSESTTSLSSLLWRL